MNGPHDLGGRQGFGPVLPEANEPLFHADWEKRALAVTLAMGATRAWTIDMARHAREKMAWHRYLTANYYDIWLTALERLIEERGLLDGPPRTLPRLAAENVAAVLARGGPCNRPARAPPLHAVGDGVRVRNLQSPGHTRLPAYLRGHRAIVAAHHGAFVFPDASAEGEGDDPQHLYTLRFSHAAVFGSTGDDEILADLFEPYLDAD